MSTLQRHTKMTVEKLQLTLNASKLKNVAGIGKGKSDPFAIVTLLATGPGETPRVLGKTEVSNVCWLLYDVCCCIYCNLILSLTPFLFTHVYRYYTIY